MSVAGHDKGMLCVIVREEDDYYYLADGRKRRLECPKKKKKKHVKLMEGPDGKPIPFAGKMLTDRHLRVWLSSVQAGSPV